MTTQTTGPATGGVDDLQAAPSPRTRTVALVLLVAGLVGCAAAFILTVEKFHLLIDPSYTPTCTINSAVSCTSVMQSAQASAFGFPNSLLGIGGFAVVAATGAMLLAGGRLARWYRIGLQLGVVAGLVFAGWLVSQSLFVIKALCPYCMVVWVATLTAFWYVTLDNLGAIRSGTADGGALGVLRRNHVALLLLVLLALAGLVVVASLAF
jgi:uncharacterized membrane protein